MKNLVTDTAISTYIKAAVNNILAETPDIDSEDGYLIDYYNDIQDVEPVDDIVSQSDGCGFIENFLLDHICSYDIDAVLAASIHYAYDLGFNQAHNSANIEEEV